MINSLDQLVEQLLLSGKKYRLAVAWAHDNSTILSIDRAFRNGFIEPIMLGNKETIQKACASMDVNSDNFTFYQCDNEADACIAAVRMVKEDIADILMKGLVSTDKLLRAVMDKENGIMRPDAVLSYVGALQIPEYHKLLFLTDPAVIPNPSLRQKIAMAEYSIEIVRSFGIEKPAVALISASEKGSKHFESSEHYKVMKEMAESGEIKNCIMDGPLDIFLACNPDSLKVKGVISPVNGDADILIFPSLEASNPFYKGLILFGGAELAGMIVGTTKPVVLMSRSESEKSKFYCIALSCLMAGSE